MLAKASHKSAPVSPRKADIVAKLVRGRTVEDALIILEYTPRKAANLLSEVIKSAMANAKNNKDMNGQLQIEEIRVNQGSHLKRYRPGAMGAAKPYKKYRSNIYVELTEVPTQTEKSAKKSKASIKKSETKSKSSKSTEKAKVKEKK